MGRLVPEEVRVTHDVNLNLHISDAANSVGKSMESLIITCTLCSIFRSWFRRK